jgi:hypothetical protein
MTTNATCDDDSAQGLQRGGAERVICYHRRLIVTSISTFRLAGGALAALALVSLSISGNIAFAAQDKFTEKVPGGLAFSEFRGYESWQVVSVSQDGDLIAAILANPVMIDAYIAGIPGNGQPFPDGAKLEKIHWNPKKMETFPAATVPGTQHDMDFMEKDSKGFADSGGWGWAVSNMTPHPIRSRPARRPANRARGTTPNADSRATRS